MIERSPSYRSGRAAPEPERGAEQPDGEASTGALTGADAQVEERFEAEMAEHRAMGDFAAALASHRSTGRRAQRHTGEDGELGPPERPQDNAHVAQLVAVATAHPPQLGALTTRQ